MIADVTGVLLAGGKSRRMGEDKRFFSIGEETLYEHSLAVLRSVFRTVVVVIAQDSPPLDIRCAGLAGSHPGLWKLGGLYTGLKQAMTPSVFAVACDMPFLDPVTIRYSSRYRVKPIW